MLRFKSLGSGSTGNATVIDSGGLFPTRVLVDCGLGVRTLAARLGEAGLQVQDLHGIFITHEHGDHVGCAPQLAARCGIPIWMSEGTWRGCRQPDLGPLLHFASDGEPIALGNLLLEPFAVPHDAQEPLQLSCTDGNRRLGILTDLGHAPDAVVTRLAHCQALLLECNHDLDLLAQSAYPAFLKRRVGGDKGHLSNVQAAGIAAQLRATLQRVVAAHLSQKNNRPELAEQALREALGEDVEIAVAHAAAGSDWMQV